MIIDESIKHNTLRNGHKYASDRMHQTNLEKEKDFRISSLETMNYEKHFLWRILMRSLSEPKNHQQ